MFGFLPAPCGCLGQDGLTAYRAHFCGLCNTMRGRYGLWSRWLINRDSTFLALLGSALQPQPTGETLATCCNPLAKKRWLVQDAEPQIFAAAVTICGLDTKLSDDAVDEKGPRKWLARSGHTLLRKAVAKARCDLERQGFPTDTVLRHLREQERVEGSLIDVRTPHKTPFLLSRASEPTAASYGVIFRHLAKLCALPEPCGVPLERVGSSLGRMIYTLDAWEDYEKDKRRGRFNPLPESTAERREMTGELLRTECQNLGAALGELPQRRHHVLLESLTGNLLRQRIENRLSQSDGPPPMPLAPDLRPPMPPAVSEFNSNEKSTQNGRRKKKMGNAGRCCLDQCCCFRSNRCGNCCDCCPHCPGGCDCGGCDGCDCCGGCDCSC